jgi:threonine synthase
MALCVSDNAISEAQQQLAKKGFYVEPTSAMAVAGLNQMTKKIDKDDIVILPLTGSGLKRFSAKKP